MTPFFQEEFLLPRSQVRGHICIDRLVGGTSFGGLRILPGSSLQETVACARTMTEKFAFWGVHHGGAKACLEIAPGSDPQRRETALGELGERYRERIQARQWLPGMDMGLRLEELQVVAAAAGITHDTSGWKDLSHLYTAWSMLAAVRVALARKQLPLADCAVAIQGLGRVGSELGRSLVTAQARIVAISEPCGTLLRPEGIDLDEVLAAREHHGEHFLSQVPGTFDPDPQAVVEADATLLLPCARSPALTRDQVNAVRAKVIVSAANAALETEVERALLDRGVLVVPDFVGNGGGVFGSAVEGFLDQKAIRSFLDTDFPAYLEKVFERAESESVDLASFARTLAARRLDSTWGEHQAGLARMASRWLPMLPNWVQARLISAWTRRRAFLRLDR